MSSSQGLAAWSHDDRFAVTMEASLFDVVQVWDARSGELVNVIRLPELDSGTRTQMFAASVDDHDRLTLTGVRRESDAAQCNRGLLCLCRKLTLSIPLRQAGEWQVTLGEQRSACDDTVPAGVTVASHDSQFVLDARDYPVMIRDRQGRIVMRLEKPEPMVSWGADLSPDGKRLALVNDLTKGEGPKRSLLTIFDLAVSKVTVQKQYEGTYAAVQWLDDQRLFLPVRSMSDGRLSVPFGGDDPVRIVSAAAGRDGDTAIPLRCGMVLLPGGALVASGIGNCRMPAAPGQGLERFDPQTGWRPFGDGSYAGAYVESLSPSPDGKTLIVAASVAAGNQSSDWFVRAIDTRTGAIRGETRLPAGSGQPDVSHARDSAEVGLWFAGINHRWDMTNAAPVPLWPDKAPVALMAQETVSRDGHSWYERTSGFTNAPITAVSVAGGRRRERTLFGEIMSEGKVGNGPLRWVVTGNDGIVFWQPNRDDPFANPDVVRINLFEGNNFFALAPDGRYDTDLGPETRSFRWLVSDAPLQSLAPQTFMRDFYEPRLIPRLLACTATRSCTKALRPIPSLAAMNRVQPQLRIGSVSKGSRPDEALVDVELRRGNNPDVPNGKTGSDGYDLRLYRDGSLVAQWPGEPDSNKPFELAQWRQDNRIVPGPGGAARKRFTVRLPSGTAPVEFTAYAFNEDRVKSETARLTYAGRPAVRAKGRVFVVALGVDNYAEKRLQLNFAAGDAQLLGSRLAAIPGGSDVRLLVVADSARPGSPRLTKRAVGDIFALLGGASRTAALARLKALGIDASMLDRAGPDDTVIISFSGHGWADPQGTFYLLPADASWPDETQPPLVASLVSTADMSSALRRIDAGEMALIIDACHSAASVDAKDFRAGPMGDAGLGQLAYDKQMRVLAATQADDVALESDKLGQGLLTFALAAEGITADGGLADENTDGAITLDEWLRYATARLPALSRDAKLARRTGGADGKARGVVFLDGDQPQRSAQEPSLFDFTGKPSKLVLRRVKP
ncbi:caspase family protein [Novosphingobium sp. B 225]|uniref:caspase family protein n=1 Tax=Novosphingobium sp. B 225 TaxID=1961849 RepID=UPI0015958E15|nr:caspase family protein [Novosphingobium sp. B 225]